MKNKILFGIIGIFFLILIMPNILANELDVNFISADPYPVKPAEIFIVQIELKNSESYNLTDIEIEIDKDWPFTPITGKQRVSLLEPDETIILDFSVYVEIDASEGEHDLTFDYSVNGDDNSETFEIRVLPTEVSLSITDVVSDPEKVEPGKNLTLTITIKNNAKSLIKDIVVKIDLTDLPFAPRESTEEYVERINSGNSAQLVFDLTVLSEAKIKIYKIPVDIEYKDSYGNSYTKSDIISTEVYSLPDIEVTVEESELIEGRISTADIKILNKGFSDINFLKISIVELPSYELYSSKENYIGKLDSDDYYTVEIKLLPKQKNIIVPLTIEYKDANNKEYSVPISLNVKVYSVDEAKQIGLIKTSKTLIYLIVIIVFIVAFIIYRKIRRKRQNVY